MSKAKPLRLPGGELEYAVLVELCALGRASARELHRRVGLPDGLVYTTTAKVLDRLYAKGLVARKLEGKAFVYAPRIAREDLDRARASDMLGRLFGADPRPAMATLVDAIAALEPDMLDELARAVAARRRSRRGS